MPPIAPPLTADPPPPTDMDHTDARPTATYDSVAPAVVGLVGDRPIEPVLSGYAAAVDSAAMPVAATAAEQTRWPAVQRRATVPGVADVPDVPDVAVQRNMGGDTTPASSWTPHVLPLSRSLPGADRPAAPTQPVQFNAPEPLAAQTIPPAQTTPPGLTTQLVVQRAEDAGEPATATSPTTTTDHTEVITPASPAGSTSPTDVDTLVRRMYDPIVRRLKAELQLDRERAGHSLDLRH